VNRVLMLLLNINTEHDSSVDVVTRLWITTGEPQFHLR